MLFIARSSFIPFSLKIEIWKNKNKISNGGQQSKNLSFLAVYHSIAIMATMKVKPSINKDRESKEEKSFRLPVKGCREKRGFGI